MCSTESTVHTILLDRFIFSMHWELRASVKSLIIVGFYTAHLINLQATYVNSALKTSGLYIMNSSSALASSLDLDSDDAARQAKPSENQFRQQQATTAPQSEPRLPRVESDLCVKCQLHANPQILAANRLPACRDRNRKSNLACFNCQPKTEQWNRYNAARTPLGFLLEVDHHLQSTIYY